MVAAHNRLLTWELTVPLAEPEVELLPFFIDWEAFEVHPAMALEPGCTIAEFYGTHPDTAVWKAKLQALGVDLPLREAPDVGLHLTLEGPKGHMHL